MSVGVDYLRHGKDCSLCHCTYTKFTGTDAHLANGAFGGSDKFVAYIAEVWSNYTSYCTHHQAVSCTPCHIAKRETVLAFTCFLVNVTSPLHLVECFASCLVCAEVHSTTNGSTKHTTSERGAKLTHGCFANHLATEPSCAFNGCTTCTCRCPSERV